MPRPVRPFDTLYERRGDDECWPWTGNRFNENRYGRWHMGGEAIAAHREAWRRANGEIPAGKHVLHTCDNPPCVNPRHLYVGTSLDNARDRKTRGRNRNQRGERHNFATLTDAQAREIRDRRVLGETAADLAREYGVKPQTIRKIVRGDRWTHVGGPTARRKTGRPRGLSPEADKRVKRLAEHGVTQAKIAAEFGISQSQVSRILHRQ